MVNVDATARANHTGTQSADTLIDGTTNKVFSATERTKLVGVATGAIANATNATLLNRANHTGTQSADSLTDGTTNVAFLATERAKLTGIAAGASTSITAATNKRGCVCDRRVHWHLHGRRNRRASLGRLDGGQSGPATIAAGTGISVTDAANSIPIAATASGATPRAILTFPTAGGANNGGTCSGVGTITHGSTGGAYTHAITGSAPGASPRSLASALVGRGMPSATCPAPSSWNIYNNNGNGTVYIRFFYSGVAGSLYGDSYAAREIGLVATGGAGYAQCGDETSGTSAALTGVNLVGNDVTITVAVEDRIIAKFSADGTLLVTLTTLPDTTTPRKRVLMERVDDDGNYSGTTLAMYGYSISYDA